MSEKVEGLGAPGEQDEVDAREVPALDRGGRIAPYVAAVALALPTLLAFYPPMSDLPMHEGVVGVLRHLGDPIYFPKDVYITNFGFPNQLFHLVSAALSFLVGTRWAVKLVIAAAQIAIFDAGVRLTDHLGRSRWAVLLLAPVALGFTYYWGLVANLIGFSAFLYALPILDRMAERPTWRSVGVASAMMIVLYLAHESTFMMATGVVVLFTIALPLDRRLTPMRLVPAVLAIALGLGHLVWQNRKFPPGLNTNVPMGWFTIRQKFVFFPNALVGSHEFLEQGLLLGLGLLAIGALLVSRVRHDVVPESTERGILRARALLHRFRYECLGFVYLAAYFTMPFNWKGVTLLHERFLGPAWMMIVICAGPRGATPRLAKFAGAVLPLGILLVNWPQFANADQTFRVLQRVIEQVPMGKTTSICIMDHPIPFARAFSAGPGPARALAERGGRSGLSLVDSPISPVRIKPEFAWNEIAFRTHVYGSRAFMPTHDFKRFEYVIGGSRDPRLREKLVRAFAPEGDVVYREGEWILFRSHAPSLPMDARDERPPESALDDTIIHRVFVMETLEERAAAGKSGGLAPVPPASDAGP
jgi:hypothetical protein